MEDAVSILKRVVQVEPNVLLGSWDDVYERFPAELFAEDAADMVALREAWTCRVWPMFLAARGGSEERAAAWEKAAAEMRSWSVEESVIEAALPLLARVLDWPEDDWRKPPAAAEADDNPADGADDDADDGARAEGAADAEAEAERYPEVRSLAALASLLAARRAAGMPELHVPLHLIVRGETEEARQALAQAVAAAAARLGFLKTADVWDGATVPEARALWYVRAGSLREDRLVDFMDVLAGDGCLAVLAGSAAEIAHLLDVCPSLRYVFPRSCTAEAAEGGGVS